MGGYKNRILRVDLTTRKFSEEQLSQDTIHDFIGGRGFGVKMLYDDLKPGVDPYGPDNELIFLAGPLAGTNAQSMARWKVFFKSPATGGYFKSSGGGRFGSEMKFSGFDGIIVKGIADKPAYLWVHDGQYELRDANYLWGLDCDDTHELIREELRDPNIKVGCIGPSGERRVKFAGIFSDRRTAGRGGGGAVMGAKNLKAIALRGKEDVALADPEGFRAAVKEQIETYRTNSHFESFSSRGSQNPEFTNLLGMFPVRNFREGVLKGWEKIECPEYAKLRVRHTACYSCMIHCGNISKVHSGPYKGYWSEGPEYETCWCFAGPFDSNEIGLTIAGDRVCDELGMDTISAAVSLSFAYELYEKGIITKKDTDGYELTWGNHAPVIPMLKKIAYREGIGDIIAEGVRNMARHYNKESDRYAIHVKGLELPGYDPRGAKAHGLNLTTIAIGADHNSGYGFQEIFGEPYKGQKLDRFAVEGKGELTKFNQDTVAFQDCGILCVFAAGLFMRGPELFSKLLAAATGVKDFADPKYMLTVGDRINNLERAFNVREGFSRKDDNMPWRIKNETLPAGPSAGKRFEQEALLDDYYKARGWDKNGIPTAETLKKLNLGFAVK